MQPILFPNLNLSFNINPVAFNLFGKDIYWYGIIIVTGIIIALFLAKRDDGKYGLKWDDVTDFLMIGIIVGIICARIYYVVFNWSYYRNNLSEIYKIWHGGLAIYGVIIGGLIVAYVYCKKKNIKFLSLCDYLAPYLPLVQAMGRWGNFINREAYGSVTDSFLKMGIFDSGLGEYIFVHPTFLYESICTLIIFIILFIIRNKRKFEGQIICLYFIMYGLARGVIEGVRTDSLMISNIRVSQILSIILVIVFGSIYLYRMRKKND